MASSHPIGQRPARRAGPEHFEHTARPALPWHRLSCRGRESSAIFLASPGQSPRSLFTVFWTVTGLTVTRGGSARDRGRGRVQKEIIITRDPERKKGIVGERKNFLKPFGPKLILALSLLLPHLTKMPLKAGASEKSPSSLASGYWT